MGLIFKIPGVQVKTYATINPADAANGFVLTNNNLTAYSSVNNGSAGWSCARATQSKSSGKWTFELVSFQNQTGAGLADAGANLNYYLGQNEGFNNNKSVAIYPGYGGSLGAGMSPQTYGSYNPGPGSGSGPIMVAVDLTAGKGWLITNNTPYRGDPVAGTDPSWSWTPGLTLFPAVSSFYGSERVITMNFGATAFTNAVPSGFNSGWYV